MRIYGKWFILFCAVAFVLFFSTCEFFNGAADPRFLDKLHGEVAWANAESLAITVAYPQEWGISPQFAGCYDAVRPNERPRKGYPFNVEFTPSMNYGFIRWLAFDLGEYAINGYDDENAYYQAIIAMSFEEAEEKSLKDRGVIITFPERTGSGAFASAVTVNVYVPVMLIPFCGDRPFVLETTPPLFNTGRTYSPGQRIRIVFNMNLDYSPANPLPFDEGFIQLSAEEVFSNGESEPYEDVQRHFNDPVVVNSVVTIDPNPYNPPPPHLYITVTVGTKITAVNGNTPSSLVRFSYYTDERIIRNIYYADNVWAIHKPMTVEDPDGKDFFYHGIQGAPDQRLRKNDNPLAPEYQIHLYFTAVPSTDEITLAPNRVKIAYIDYADLAGQDAANIEVRPMERSFSISAVSDDVTVSSYRSASITGSDTAVYHAVYTWSATYSKAGIKRLVVMPYNDLSGAEDFLDNWSSALSNGGFVTVVLDNQPPGPIPGGTVSFAYGGAASESGGVYNYNSTDNKTLHITANFSGIADNSGDGILSATTSRPRTMDDRNNVFWQYRIVTLDPDPDNEYIEHHTSDWIRLTTNTASLDLTKTKKIQNMPSSTTVRQLQIKYRDSLWNTTNWENIGRIRYYNTAQDVWAIHNPDSYAEGSIANDFFYQGAPLERDRRLRANNEVTLFFYVPGTNENTRPNKVRIAEIHYAALQGSDINTLIPGRGAIDLPIDLPLEPMEAGEGANDDYMERAGLPANATFYSVTHTVSSASAGIIRLAVMPYSGDWDDSDSWQTAIAEGRFVTVVNDKSAPGGTATFTTSGGTGIRDSNNVLLLNNSNTAARSLTITGNLAGITDNAGVGIPSIAATQDKPWTMETPSSIQWQFRIARGTTQDYESTWVALSTASRNNISLATLTSNAETRNIEVRYRDSLQNTSDWFPTGQQIRYYNNAQAVWAIHPTGTASTDFFYQGAATSRDRRLRGTVNSSSVNIYFYVPNIADTPQPTDVRVVELNYATLQGNENTIPASPGSRDFQLLAVGTTGVDQLYRTANNVSNVTYHKFTYTWDSTNQATPGIIRLAVMPYWGAAANITDTWQFAIAEGRFVTVVMDNSPPGGTATFTTSGGTGRRDSNNVLLFNNLNANINITGNFSGIADNAGIGILPSSATQDKPWTMDTTSNIQWQFRIANFESTWVALSTTSQNNISLASITSNIATRNIEVRYRDNLQNTSGWFSTGQQIRYFDSAHDVWAIHNPTTTSSATDFFYQGAATSRDRRLRSNNQVTLFFYVPNTTVQPDRVRIAEIDYATLQGNDVNTPILGRDNIIYTVATNTMPDGAGANNAYKTGKPTTGVTYYRVTHTLPEDTPAGIIRLAVMPYRNANGIGDDTWQTAITDGRFVTIVKDNLPPGGTATFTTSGGTGIRDSNNVLLLNNLNANTRNLTLTGNFAGIADNSGIGILPSFATQDKPWTMDAPSGVQWQFRIANFESTWATLNTARGSISLASLASNAETRNIEVRYRDSLQNTSDWFPTGQQIRYYDNAQAVWAIHPTGTATTDFFFQGADTTRDRRLRGTANNSSVTVYFYVPNNVAGTQPTNARVVELNYATLQGNENTIPANPRQREFTLTQIPTTATGVDLLYRNANNATGRTYYKFTYTWDSTNQATQGIIRLAVMPYWGATANITDTWQTAIVEGRFVTVVMDNQPPGGFASINLSGQASMAGDVHVFIPGADILTINANLTGIADNSGVGILPTNATADKPWTMDAPTGVRWRYRIITGTNANPGTLLTDTITSDWEGIGTTSLTYEFANSGITSAADRRIFIQYRDSLGIESQWSASMGRLRYDPTAQSAVSAWSATYRDETNTIELTWTRVGTPTIEVWVNGVRHGTGTTATDSSPYRITGIPRINDSGIKSGQPVNNVMEYNISLIPVYPNGVAQSTNFKIWNIPGMENNQEHPIEEIRTKANFDSMVLGDPDKKYVLMNDITTTSRWTPMGTDSNTFQGKFYGNGHTITINSFIIGTAGIDRGIFGTVNNAEIRDLRVEYPSTLSITETTTNFGGITAQANGTTAIRNVIVGRNNGTVIVATGANNSNVGMITGLMEPNVTIENCYAALNLRLTSTGGTTNLGGLAGLYTSLVLVDGVEVAVTGNGAIRNSIVLGSLGMSGSGTTAHTLGGIVGSLTGGTISSCDSNVTINVPHDTNTFTVTGSTSVGGVVGNVQAASAVTVLNTNASGNITVTSRGSSRVYIGGVCGASNLTTAQATTFTNCEYSSGVINFTRAEGSQSTSIGGFAGYINTSVVNDCNSKGFIKVEHAANISTNSHRYRIGGFAGELVSSTSTNPTNRCYSTTSIEFNHRGTRILNNTNDESNSNQFGGFAGYVSGNFTISECYATGSITVISLAQDNQFYYAGGFAGGIARSGSTGRLIIRDCYSTGSISVDRINASGDTNIGGTTDIGGFVGHMFANTTINRCFSTGSFTLRASGGRAGSTGGIAGYARAISCLISDSLALGSFIISLVDDQANRISVDHNDTAADFTNNYALDSLQRYRINSNNTSTLVSWTPLTRRDGTTISRVMLTPTFYRNTVAQGGVGFSDTIWDLGAPVTRNGWPTLRNVGGPQ